ncbi:MAG: sugar transferase [Solirubrobacterales bacterium]
MHKSNKLAFFNVYYLITDIIGLILAYEMAYIVTSQFTTLYNIKVYAWVILVYIPTWVFMMGVNGMYNNTTFKYYDRIFKNVLGASTFTSVLIAALMYAVKETMFSRMLFFNFFLIAFTVLLIIRYLMSYVLVFPDGKNTKQVLVIGTQEMYDKFNYYVKKTNIRIKVEKYIHIDQNETLNTQLLNTAIFKEELMQHVVDEIYFALPIKYFKEIQEYILIAEEMGITSRVLLDIVDNKFSRVHVASLGTFPMVTFHSVSLNSLQLFTKRIIDIIGALVGIVLSSPIWIIAAIIIKLDSPGPIFFTQDRVGTNGRVFKLYKLRSMCINADEKKNELLSQNEMSGNLMFKVKDDPRITRFGKFIRRTSIDEIPQFINVLKGDMSLVGTRPPTVEEVSHYDSYHRRRISIKPGITGMWQVSGRSTITAFDEVVALDTNYIDKWSVWLDIKIILKTIIVVFLTKRGAC